MKKLPIWLRSLLGGICLAVPFLPISSLSAPLAYIAGIPALFFLFADATEAQKKRYRSYLYRGFFFAFGFYLGVYHWFIAMYPLDFIADLSPLQAALVVCVAWLGLAMIATLCFGFIFPTFSIFANLTAVRQHPLLLPPLFASVWTVFSALITLTWMGVPWGMMAITQAAHPTLIATASLFGGYFITFIIMLVNGYLALGLLLFCRAEKNKRRRLLQLRLPACLALGVFLLNFLVGSMLDHRQSKPDGTVTVGLLQGNVSSRDKWNNENESLHDRYERLLRELVAEADARAMHPDIVIWSETAIPSTLTDIGTTQNSTTKWLMALSKELRIANLVGAFSRIDNGGAEKDDYNSLFLFRADGSRSDTLYHKRRPVPFGEFLPWKPFINAVFPYMATLAMMNDLTAGEDTAIFEENFGRIGSLICFDSIYESLARASVREGAEVLVISTNDSWFGRSAALAHHHAQAVLRAVENGRYVLRAGNTGITSVISDKGELIQSLEPLTEGYLIAEVPLYTHRTLYNMIGNLFLYVAALFVLSLTLPDAYGAIQSKIAKKREKTHQEEEV